MAKKDKFVFMLLHGTHRRRSPGGKGWEIRTPGDTITVDDPSELGSFLDSWKLVRAPKKEEKKVIIQQMKKAGGLPPKTVDGINTSGFVDTEEFHSFHKKMYPVYMNPVNEKKYWLSKDGALTPIPEKEDDLKLDEKGDVAGDIAEDDSKGTLFAIPRGGGWWDVWNSVTQKPINDRALRQKEAKRLADGKTLESTRDLAGQQSVHSGGRSDSYEHISGEND